MIVTTMFCPRSWYRNSRAVVNGLVRKSILGCLRPGEPYFAEVGAAVSAGVLMMVGMGILVAVWRRVTSSGRLTVQLNVPLSTLNAATICFSLSVVKITSLLMTIRSLKIWSSALTAEVQYTSPVVAL